MCRFMLVVVLVGSCALPLTALVLDDKKPKDADGPVVYVVPNGGSYHKSQRCVALRRSRTINEMSLAEAVKSGRAPCGHCSPPVPEPEGPVEVDASYLEKLPGIKVKSASANRIRIGTGGPRFLPVTILLEFTKNVPESELKAIKQAFADKPCKFKFVALDPDNVVVPLPDGARQTFIIEGELTGVKGDSFRMKFNFDGKVMTMTKKVVIREVQPVAEKSQP